MSQRPTLLWAIVFSLVVGGSVSHGGEEDIRRIPLNKSGLKKLRKRVRSWIEQLGHDEFNEREKAGKRLESYLYLTYPILVESKNHSDPEVRTRVNVIVQRRKHGYAEDIGLAWLAYHQADDGGWNGTHGGKNRELDVARASVCLLAFLGAGHTQKVGKFQGNVRIAVDYLVERQRKDGAVVAKSGKIDGFSHVLATLALSEAAGMGDIPDTKKAARKGFEYACKALQLEKNGKKWGLRASPEARVSNLFVTALFALAARSIVVGKGKVPEEVLGGLRSYVSNLLDKKQQFYAFTPGGQGNPVATILACVARDFLGAKQEVLRPFAAKAMSLFYGPIMHDGSVMNDPHANPWGNYFGTLCFFHLGGKMWQRWNKKMKVALLGTHTRDTVQKDLIGSWAPYGRPEDGANLGRAGVSAINNMCLQIYYRYLPILR